MDRNSTLLGFAAEVVSHISPMNVMAVKITSVDGRQRWVEVHVVTEGL